jgi:hypothetical protein
VAGKTGEPSSSSPAAAPFDAGRGADTSATEARGGGASRAPDAYPRPGVRSRRRTYKEGRERDLDFFLKEEVCFSGGTKVVAVAIRKAMENRRGGFRFGGHTVRLEKGGAKS